jgi:hypothetical protein
MEDTTTKNKKNFFQNFGLMACSMLVIYEVCIIGMGTSTFWGWQRWEQNISVISTATTIAHSTEQSQFEVVDRFDNTTGRWHVGDVEIDGRWDGSMEIKEGVYILKVNEVQKPFIQHNSSFSEFPLKDFDVYLDTKFAMGESGDVCGGLVFRRSFKGWGYGAYIFIICNDSTFKIAYYDEQGWKSFSGKRFSEAILPTDWNRIEDRGALARCQRDRCVDRSAQIEPRGERAHVLRHDRVGTKPMDLYAWRRHATIVPKCVEDFEVALPTFADCLDGVPDHALPISATCAAIVNARFQIRSRSCEPLRDPGWRRAPRDATGESCRRDRP